MSGGAGPWRLGSAACAAAVLLACSTAAPVPEGYWAGPTDAPVPASLRGGRVLHTAALRRLLRERPVLIDVSGAPRRPQQLAPGSVWLPPPHLDIPGSRWIPGAGLAAIPADIDVLYRDSLRAATGGDLGHAVVVYCHAHCWLSWNAARRAVRYGYRNVWWYPDGVEGWRVAGGATAAVDPVQPPAPAADGRAPDGA